MVKLDTEEEMMAYIAAGSGLSDEDVKALEAECDKEYLESCLKQLGIPTSSSNLHNSAPAPASSSVIENIVIRQLPPKVLPPIPKLPPPTGKKYPKTEIFDPSALPPKQDRSETKACLAALRSCTTAQDKRDAAAAKRDEAERDERKAQDEKKKRNDHLARVAQRETSQWRKTQIDGGFMSPAAPLDPVLHARAMEALLAANIPVKSVEGEKDEFAEEESEGEEVDDVNDIEY